MPIILFDIDYTLLNTGKLIREYVAPALCQQLNLSSEKFEELKTSYIGGLAKYTDFTPEDLLTFCLTQQGTDPASEGFLARHAEVLAAYYSPEFYPNSLYPGVPELLQQLTPEHTLGIFSEGNKNFQTKKLLLTGISGFFADNYTYIFGRKLEPETLRQLPPESIVVDDNPEVIDTLADWGIKTVWVKRPERPTPPTQVGLWVEDLNELPTLLKQAGV
jgi:FMN phosphatase YigB (HAD superfamily)